MDLGEVLVKGVTSHHHFGASDRGFGEAAGMPVQPRGGDLVFIVCVGVRTHLSPFSGSFFQKCSSR